MKQVVIPVPACAKPRMTRSAKWAPTEAQQKYWDFKADLLALGYGNPPVGGLHIHFVIGMPRSWSQKKKDTMNGTPHQQTPDVDNLHKGLLDALMKEDKEVWDHHITKWWGHVPCIILQGVKKAVFPL